MKRSIRFVLTGVLGMTGIAMILSGHFPAISQERNQGKVPSGIEDQDSLKLIHGYQKWTKVNPKPIFMQPAPAAQCAAPWPNQQSCLHLQKYITVYVNKAGQQAMTLQKTPHFPVGTVLVKEKLHALDSKSPELITAMLKRAKGYNPNCDDWEYLVYDGTGTKVQAQGKLEKCQSCHLQQPARAADYVFRDYYLPQSRRSALK